MFDKHPLVVIRAEQVADVIGGVNGLELAVRGGAPGSGTCDGGVVIDLSPMESVDVDPKAGTARVGGGATWGDFNYATQAYGLVTTGGIVSITGIAGLTRSRCMTPFQLDASVKAPCTADLWLLLGRFGLARHLARRRSSCGSRPA